MLLVALSFKNLVLLISNSLMTYIISCLVRGLRVNLLSFEYRLLTDLCNKLPLVLSLIKSGLFSTNSLNNLENSLSSSLTPSHSTPLFHLRPISLKIKKFDLLLMGLVLKNFSILVLNSSVKITKSSCVSEKGIFLLKISENGLIS